MANKKYTIVLSFALISLVSFLVGYLLTNPNNISSSNQLGNILNRFSGIKTLNPSTYNLPGSVFVLSSEPVVSATNSLSSGKVVYYSKNSGKVFEVGLSDKNITTVSSTPLPGLLNTLWSPNKKEVISTFYSSEGNVFKYYNYDSGRSIVLDKNIHSLSFSPEGDFVVYFKSSGGVGDVETSSPDGSFPRKIINTRLDNISLAWPNDKIITLQTPSESGTGSDLYFLTTDGKLSLILNSENNLEESWSQDGKIMLYSYLDSDNKYELHFLDTSSNNDSTLGIETKASSCAWSIDSKTIFCAVTNSKSGTIDLISKDITNSTVNTLAKNLKIHPTDLFLSRLEDYLIFRDTIDDYLYAIKLNP